MEQKPGLDLEPHLDTIPESQASPTKVSNRRTDTDMGRSGHDFTVKKSVSRVGTPMADTGELNFNEYPTGAKSPVGSNVGGFQKSQFTYNEDTHTFETIMEKEIKQ